VEEQLPDGHCRAEVCVRHNADGLPHLPGQDHHTNSFSPEGALARYMAAAAISIICATPAA
jgi:hypothetical protein